MPPEGQHARHPRFVCVGVAAISRRRQHRDPLALQHRQQRQLAPPLLACSVSVERENQLPSLRDKQLITRIKRLHRGGMTVRQIATKVTVEGYRSHSDAPVRFHVSRTFPNVSPFPLRMQLSAEQPEGETMQQSRTEGAGLRECEDHDRS